MAAVLPVRHGSLTGWFVVLEEPLWRLRDGPGQASPDEDKTAYGARRPRLEPAAEARR